MTDSENNGATPKASVDTIREPARDIPVFRRCDVLVVGAGPAGCAAASAARKMGADIILVERYGQLGGLSTGGLVVWIDRMTDWTGRQVIAGFANDLLDRLPEDAVLGPPRELWGSTESGLLEYWQDRFAAFNGVVTWSPTVDPELLKIAYLDAVHQDGLKLLLHSWAVGTVMDGNRVAGVIFESKSGRQAILADVVIDTTGDGDIFALAGAPFETGVDPTHIHHKMNVAFRWTGLDMERYLDFRRGHADEYRAIMDAAKEQGVATDMPRPMPDNREALFHGPRLNGYDCLNVEDLTAVEVESRHNMMDMLHFYRASMPGFEQAKVLETAPQIGVRHGRRLTGVGKMVREEWTTGKIHQDEIAVSPAPNPRHPNVSVPLSALLPVGLENLLAAGRNISCDPVTHAFIREVPQCWAMGHAAGVAAVSALSQGGDVHKVEVAHVQQELLKQGAYLSPEVSAQLV